MTGEGDGTAKRRWALAAILGLFLGCAVLYNVSTPLYEAPDELQHAAFVVWLADGGSLPAVDPADLGPWEQEGTQPPLYYWIVATLVGGLRHDEAGSLGRLNPYAGVGDPQRPDNKNRVLHDLEQERWPYGEGVLFLHLARGLSTLMAVGTLGAVYCLGRIVFPERGGVALGMVGVVAFMPQFLFLSASLNNDNLVILIASWVLVILARWLRAPQPPGWPALAGLGIVLGLGVLAKYSGLLLWPLAAGVMFWLAWRKSPTSFEPVTGLRAGRLRRLCRWLIPAGLIVFGLALALSGWWFARNYQLYGELSGINTHLEIMGTRRRLPSLVKALREFKGFRYSFWALFGWFNILAPAPFYWIADGLTVLGVAGLGVFLARSLRRLPHWTWYAVAMLGAWLALVLAGVVQWTLKTPASQGRLLYPALGAIALFLVAGWAELIPRHLRRPVGVLALAAWVVWAILCPFLSVMPAYALPERVGSLDQLAVEPSELHVRYGGCCELMGYIALDEPVHPGDRVPLALVWQAAEAPERDFSLFVHAVAPDGQIVGQVDTYHGGGMYPTGQWYPGEIVVDTVYVPISWQAEGPSLVRFNVGLHEASGAGRLPAFGPDGEALDVVFAGEVALAPFEWLEPQSNLQTDAVFGQQIRLAGIELPRTTVHPGEVLTVTLQWEALTRIREDYTGFIHLVAPGGGNAAQDDHLPLAGRFPTRLWSPGMVISDPYQLELPEELEAGTYELVGGFYRPESGERLQATSPETGERWKDDLVHFGEIVVVTQQ